MLSESPGPAQGTLSFLMPYLQVLWFSTMDCFFPFKAQLQRVSRKVCCEPQQILALEDLLDNTELV